MNKTRNSIIILVSLAIITFFTYSIWLIVQPTPLEIQGEVEATQVKISSKLVGRIDSLAINRGDKINKGDLLFRIESPEVDAKLMQVEALQKAAMATNSKANAGARKEDIQAAFNTWKKAEAAANYMKKTYQRVENLYQEGVLPEQKKDEAETGMTAAVETEKAARAIYNKAQAGARDEDKDAAQALVDQANGAVNEVNIYVAETLIYAPMNGEVANIIAEVGELVPAGYPVVSIVDLSDTWVSFHLREDLLSQVKKGSVMTARIPAMGMKEVQLRVSYIHVLGAFANWSATKTSGDFDMKTFEVHARPVDPIDGFLPGMTVLVDWEQFNS